jgi:hypothetical protein
VAALAVNVVPTTSVPVSLLATGARSTAICDVVLRFVVPSFTVQVMVRAGWAPVEVSVPPSW